MSKPHEQELSAHPLDSRVVIDAEGLVVADVRARTSEDARDMATLFAAAPEMARALLDVTPIVDGVAHSPLCGRHGLGHGKQCHYTCADINAALIEAKVLP